jgi:hypothetical protein
MPSARLAQAADLIPLYRASEVSATAEPIERAEQIWREILSNKSVAVLIPTMDVRIAASCMLISTPNLLRTGRQHAFLENVVTHPELRGRVTAARWSRPPSQKPGPGTATTF